MRNLLLFLTFSIGLSSFVFSQCNTLDTAAPSINLIGPGMNSAGISIAYNPQKKLYYSISGSVKNNNVVTYDSLGNQLHVGYNTNFDHRGLWWNPILEQLETHGNNTNIRYFDLDSNDYAQKTTNFIFSANQPFSQSCGKLDYIDNEILYYFNGRVYRKDRVTNATIGNFVITGLPVPASNLEYFIGYTGCIGKEIVVYDYVNKALYYINKTTGAYVTTTHMPASVPSVSWYNMSYANEQVFFRSGTTWTGYRVIPKCDSLTVTVSPIGSVCAQTAVTLNASSIHSASISWDNGVTNNVPFFPSITKTYTATSSDSNDCFATKVVPVKPLSFSSSSIEVCESYLSPSGNTYTSSGTYYDTLSNTIGCDSIITTNLIVNYNTPSILNINSCGAYTSPSGNYVWLSSGTYFDTIPTSRGCDSTITIQLSVYNSTFSSISDTVCDAYYSPSGKYVWGASGIYNDTIPNSNGCDSIITFDLTIKKSSLYSFSQTVCDSIIAPSGKVFYSSGLKYDTIPNAVGCDSIILINLTVYNTTYHSFSQTVCDSYVSPSANYTWNLSGIYQDTIPNSNGCDSVLTINLTVNKKSFSIINRYVCDSYTSPSGNYVWTETGLYFDTLVGGNSKACDSIITVNLSVRKKSFDTLNVTSCLSYTSPSGKYNWTTSGSYLDTIPNAEGCDSIMLFNLTITQNSINAFAFSACDSLVSPSGNFVYKSSGTYIDTLFGANSQGCDSIMIINLSIKNTTYSSINVSRCDKYISPSGNYTWTLSGVYQDTLLNAAACDSVITINLTILNSTYHSINPVVCDAYTSPSGIYTWTNTGIYTDTLTNSIGCDSILTINLTIKKSTYDTINALDCYSYTSPSGNYVWTNSGVYQDTIANAAACDSIITINLTVVSSSVNNISILGCDSVISPSGKYTWKTNGLYMDTLTSSLGCDSILWINLSIYSKTFTTVNITSCDSLVSPSGNYTWHSNGTYQDTISGLGGCDSVLTINLSILNSTYFSFTDSACVSYPSPSGKFIWKSSGVFNDTLVNSVGCDSIISITLLIKENSFDTINVSNCYSYVSPSTLYTWTTSGIYHDTLPNAIGCDSIITIHLTIDTATADTINISGCNQIVSPSGNYTWTTSGTYVDTLVNSKGCDSLLTVVATIYYPTSVSTNVISCDFYISPSGLYTWNSSGTYKDTIVGLGGCDSILSIQLTILNSTSFSIFDTACGSYISPSGNYTYTNSGIYFDTIPNSIGCDSVITLNLLIKKLSRDTISVDACVRYVSPSGKYTWNLTGTYQDTLTNAVGCDSIITINLKVFDISSSINSFSSCDSLISPSGKFVWTSSGIYRDTLVNHLGCDSVMLISLTILNPTYDTTFLSVCDIYTSPSGKYNWTSSGVYQDTISNVVGCDSILTINLTVNKSTAATVIDSACSTYISPSGNYTWTQSGTYFDTIPSAIGCDSLLTIQLKILESRDTIFVNACDTFVSPSGLYHWSQSGTYFDTIPNTASCDSLIVINLSIDKSYDTLNVVSCDTFVSPSGKYIWNVSGNYLDTLVAANAMGCDSIININLTIDTIDITVTLNEPILTANAIGASYQWLDCDSAFAAISGANSAIFTAVKNGNYAVEIRKNGCIDTSACYSVLNIGLNEQKQLLEVSMYPNPTEGKLIIDLHSFNENIELKVSDINGRVVFRNNYKHTMRIDLELEESRGVYFVELRNEKGSTKVMKLVKSR